MQNHKKYLINHFSTSYFSFRFHCLAVRIFSCTVQTCSGDLHEVAKNVWIASQQSQDKLKELTQISIIKVDSSFEAHIYNQPLFNKTPLCCSTNWSWNASGLSTYACSVFEVLSCKLESGARISLGVTSFHYRREIPIMPQLIQSPNTFVTLWRQKCKRLILVSHARYTDSYFRGFPQT